MKYILLFVILVPIYSLGQILKINGSVKDQNNVGIENASVVVYDLSENILVYDLTDQKGLINLSIDRKNVENIKIEISSLGFLKKDLDYTLKTLNSLTFTAKLEENREILKEVVILSDQKIRINQDTTFLKVSKFINNTEQTLEDVLRKLPGIKIEADGSIRAHGKIIDKLLIDGDDLFDKNYKILSKNLDAKVLEEVQILDNFEDNPILKNLSESDKVALNIKFKEGFNNVWFGNISLGIGTKARFKESLNIGLLRKKIKFFYFGDYNNIGDKSTNLITENQESIDLTDFDEKIEKKTKSIFSISDNENTQFKTTQSLFNKALLNSVSLSTKLTDKIKVRAVSYFLNDKQNQNSQSYTEFNVDSNPIFLSEKSNYISTKTLTSTEVEVKYLATSKSFFTNYSTYQNNPEKVFSDLVSNQNLIAENLQDKNESFYNHFQNTYAIGENKVLTNYFYLGNNVIKQHAIIQSESLNAYLNNDPNQNVLQNEDNQLNYVGYKTSLIIKSINVESFSTLTIESDKEYFSSVLYNPDETIFLSNENVYLKKMISLNQNIKYFLSPNIKLSSNINISKIKLNKNDLLLFNPSANLELSLNKLGRLMVSYDYNSKVPENSTLLPNNQLTSYRSFLSGEQNIMKINRNSFSINYSLFNTPKRYSIEASVLVFNTLSTYNLESTIDQDFNQYNYFISKGGNSIMTNFGLTNYFKKIKLATKIESNQNWSSNPIKLNSNVSSNIENYFATYKLSGTTFYKKFINFDFGFNYNIFQSKFKNTVSKNKTSDYFVTVNHVFNQIWVSELKYTLYNLDSKNYSFLNASLSYNPIASNFSYTLIINNLANEETYSTRSINSYATNKTTIDLVPRYVLFSTKYRF
jgi:hypothetical protein